MRENHYAILAHLKISQVSNYKISITLLLNLNIIFDRVVSIRLQR